MSSTQHKLTIKTWAPADRPREKLLLKGRVSLSDAELVAILIGSGIRNKSAVELSREILGSVSNNLNELAKLSVKDLSKFNGIGEAKAISIAAALELGRRRRETAILKRKMVGSSNDVFELFGPRLEDLDHEEFWILLLNRANLVIGKYEISKGGVSGTVADSKIIFKTAIENLASAIILCHNHPSGNLKPSTADLKLTDKLKKAGQLMEIPVLDHIIISENGYFSMADEGLI
ncbi:MAG TPA: JAB domain-containing protein [Flavobacteriales bacterium]|nr:JAB domain-containing protein [Flavobacteriales bacterium]HIN39239.1 JAB domain-containing protein [Flavobacteriales bacterium]